MITTQCKKKTQETCVGCFWYISNIDNLREHRAWQERNKRRLHLDSKGQIFINEPEPETANPFPLDVEWKNCRLGPDKWLNCDGKEDKNEEIEENAKYVLKNTKRVENLPYFFFGPYIKTKGVIV